MFTMNSLIFTVILLTLLCTILVIIGREFEERSPQDCDYLNSDGQSTLLQQLRTGMFFAIDYASYMIWPGSREKAIYLKRMRKTKAELMKT